jgi:hypothetical protein
MKELVSVCPAGPFVTSAIAQHQKCGSIELTVATCITMASKALFYLTSRKATTLLVCWMLTVELWLLAKMARFEFLTSLVQQFCSEID